MPLVKRGRVGIIGHRSWIAERLMQRLHDETDLLIMIFDKKLVREGSHAPEIQDMSQLECLYVFAGRARPTDAEMLLEIELIKRLAAMSPLRRPKRIVYLSSQAVWYATEYGRTKRVCEGLLVSNPTATSVRPGAVFGHGQDPMSTMLIPTLAREDGETTLSTPDRPTMFTWIEDLVSYLIALRDLSIKPESWTEVPGSFEMTPRQMQALYNTWKGYRQ